jgi:hypothetical protein
MTLAFDQINNGGEASARRIKIHKTIEATVADGKLEDIQAQPSQVTTKHYTCVLTLDQFDTWFEKIETG